MIYKWTNVQMMYKSQRQIPKGPIYELMYNSQRADVQMIYKTTIEVQMGELISLIYKLMYN